MHPIRQREGAMGLLWLIELISCSRTFFHIKTQCLNGVRQRQGTFTPLTQRDIISVWLKAFNPTTLGQSGQHFADNIFKCTFLQEKNQTWFHWRWVRESIWQYDNIGSVKGLATKRRQAITPNKLTMINDTHAGLTQGLLPANERRLNKIKPSLIGWAKT